MSAMTEIVVSICTQPSTAGPMTIPRTSSRTTDGSFTRGSSPSVNGTANATVTTMSRPEKLGASIASRSPRDGAARYT